MKNLDRIFNEELQLDEMFGFNDIKNGFADLGRKAKAGFDTAINKDVQSNSVNNTNKFNYLKNVYYLIYMMEKTSGEDKINNKDVAKYRNYLFELVKVLIPFVKTKPHWSGLFAAVKTLKDNNISILIEKYNTALEKSGIKGLRPYKSNTNSTDTKQDSSGDVYSQWADALANGSIKNQSGNLASSLKSFQQLFPESKLNDIVRGFLTEELDHDAGDFEDAMKLIQDIKAGTSEFAKAIKAYKTKYPDKYKKRIEKYYNSLPDDKKNKFKEVYGGKSEKPEEKKPEEGEPVTVADAGENKSAKEQLIQRMRDSNKSQEEINAVLKDLIDSGFLGESKVLKEDARGIVDKLKKMFPNEKERAELYKNPILQKVKQKIASKDNSPDKTTSIVKAKAAEVVALYNKADSAKKDDFEQYIELAFKQIGLTNRKKYSGRKLIRWLEIASKSSLKTESVNENRSVINVVWKYKNLLI